MARIRHLSMFLRILNSKIRQNISKITNKIHYGKPREVKEEHELQLKFTQTKHTM